MPFSDHDVPGFVDGYGSQIRRDFVIPLLKESISYSRISSYFKIRSLAVIGEGLQEIWKNDGEVRLLLGEHDMDSDLLDAFLRSEDGDSDPVISAIEDRICSQAAEISDELEKDAVAAVAWLIHVGKLEIRVGATRSPVSGSILHNKRLIFQDSEGNVVAASGSQNETSLTTFHYEELSVHKSWIDSAATEQMLDSFEKMWLGENSNLLVRPLSRELARKLAKSIDRSLEAPNPEDSNPKNTHLSLRDALLASPAHSQFSLQGIALYPHQERVLLDACARIPLRILLADEVGLGKTLEAISLINVMVRFNDVGRILIVTPPHLMVQWQEELLKTLGLEFLRWDSQAKAYLNSNHQRFDFGADSAPLGPKAPPLVMMSQAIFRSRGFSPQLDDPASLLPDLLIVDEAHAARVKIDENSGKRKETLLWKQLDSIAGRVQHLILLTATPMQVQPIEFFELLKLLGLPEEWQKYDYFEKSLSWLVESGGELALPEASHFAEGLESLINEFGTNFLSRFPEVSNLVARFTGTEDHFERASIVRENWVGFRKLLVILHPASQLVIRNTRTSLEALGYQFPDRSFHAPNLQVSDEILDFHDELFRYLSEGFGLTEEAQGNSRAGQSAFQKSRWWERTSSSLYAALMSIANRVEKIEEAAAGLVLEEDEEEWDEASFHARQRKLEDKQSETVRQAALKEKSYLVQLGDIAKDILTKSGGLDPKFLAVREEVEKALEANIPILVFSRWVNTLDGCIEYLEDAGALSSISYAMYSGDKRWIRGVGGARDVSKHELVAALNSGEVRIVFCSEAASEGLNLQRANRLVNIDVPWNPARLEQRIGRIARLGQKSQTVDIVNLWYPGSIEKKIYTRLLARKELFSLAVGEMPSLFSEKIESAINSNSDVAIGAEEAKQVLEQTRQSIQARALREVWGRAVSEERDSTVFRESLVRLLESCKAGRSTADTLPGATEAASIWDLSLLAGASLETAGYELYSARIESGLVVGFLIGDQEGSLRLLGPGKVLVAASTDADLDDDELYDSEWFARGELSSQLLAGLSKQRWLPTGFARLIESYVREKDLSVVKITRFS